MKINGVDFVVIIIWEICEKARVYLLLNLSEPLILERCKSISISLFYKLWRVTITEYYTCSSSQRLPICINYRNPFINYGSLMTLHASNFCLMWMRRHGCHSNLKCEWLRATEFWIAIFTYWGQSRPKIRWGLKLDLFL